MNTFTPELQKQFNQVFIPVSDFKRGMLDCAADIPMDDSASEEYRTGYMKQYYNEQAAKKDYRG